MHAIVTTFRGADIKVEVANFCAAMDTLIDQDDPVKEFLKPAGRLISNFLCLIMLHGE